MVRRLCLVVLWLSIPVLVAAHGRRPPLVGRPSAPVVVLDAADPRPLQLSTISGAPYAMLEDVARWTGGHLHWHPVAHRVHLSVRDHDLDFQLDSDQAWLDGKLEHLPGTVVKSAEGVWVPLRFLESGRFSSLTRTQIAWNPQRYTLLVMRMMDSYKTEPGSIQVRMQFRDDQSVTPVPPVAPESTRPSLPRVHAIRRIVIDPGHGGKDPGATGVHGTEEKTINLTLAKELADVLRDNDGYEVLLTRMDDTFIPLQERSRLANAYKADLFISIHCNSSLSSRLKGFEVYFLSEKASDPHAAAVARIENASLALEGKKPNTVAQRVLSSLVKNGNINEASALGSLVDREAAKRLSQPHLGVKQAGFYVLRGAAMPAILVETAFLSNSRDERLLRDRRFRARIVDAMEAAINDYDERHTKKTG